MKATEVGSVTLVGTSDERPSQWGNCFTVKCDDGKWYRIVNFNHENLEALEKMGLTWPIECEALSDRVAVIMDGRIGERWYQDRYCEVCTPRDLLPITQRQRHARDIARGRREESNGHVMIRMDRDYAQFD
jgi:hypothetical protein